MKKHNLKTLSLILSLIFVSLLIVSCGNGNKEETTATGASDETTTAESEVSYLTKDDITVNETYENSADGEHAVTADGQTVSYSNIGIYKTGSSSGDEADFYGENSAAFATNGGVLNLTGVYVNTYGTHANAVFSYGEGTTVDIENSVIETTGNCSGGIMTTGGGTMNANNLTIYTTGNSSAAIRSDRGGGVVTVNGGIYTTDGTGSPVIYSTADISVGDAKLVSNASQGVVVEGKNSVTLNNCDVTANNTKKNSDKSSYYQAVMIYQSMSGDADVGNSSFTMTGGKLVNKNGDIFFVNNTTCEINLSGADITNESDGIFLRVAAAGWGSEGSNGGKVTLNASKQNIDGNIIVDSYSSLVLNLSDNSVLEGAINSDGQNGTVNVFLTGGAVWKLTADSYVSTLDASSENINLNGHTLYVNGVAYTG